MGVEGKLEKIGGDWLEGGRKQTEEREREDYRKQECREGKGNLGVFLT